MRRILALLIALLLLSPELPAQPSNDWKNVENLRRETPVVIWLWDGERLSGRLGPVTDTGLCLFPFHHPKTDIFQAVEVAREEIRKIVRINEPKLPDPQKWIVTDTVIGGVGGAIAGGIYDATHHTATPHALTWGFGGAGIGFLGTTVVLLGIGGTEVVKGAAHHSKVIYEGTPPRRDLTK